MQFFAPSLTVGFLSSSLTVGLLPCELEEPRGQFRTDAFVFMFEKDEGVFPFLFLHAFHPTDQVIFFIVRATKSKVTPRSGVNDFIQRFFVGV